MDFLLDVSANVKGIITFLSEQQQRYIFWTRSCPCSLRALARLVASLRLFALPPQQSRHRPLNPDVLGTSCPQQHPPQLLVLLPHQKDLLWAGWKGKLHHSSVWFAGAKESPAKALAAHSCHCWCIYSKSWRFQWFQLLLSALGRTKPLRGWQGGHAGALVAAHLMEQGKGSCFRAWPSLLSTWSCFRNDFTHLGKMTRQCDSDSHISPAC